MSTIETTHGSHLARTVIEQAEQIGTLSRKNTAFEVTLREHGLLDKALERMEAES